jgi:hypothetical protein
MVGPMPEDTTRPPVNIPGFRHEAMRLGPVAVIFTAMSRRVFHRRVDVSRFVLSRGFCPANPYMSFDADFFGLVEKERIISANNSLLGKADELWVFGPVSDGVLAEVLRFLPCRRPVRFLEIRPDGRFQEARLTEVEFETDVAHLKQRLIRSLRQHGLDAAGHRPKVEASSVNGKVEPTTRRKRSPVKAFK